VKVKFATDVYNKNIKAYDTVHTHLVGTMWRLYLIQWIRKENREEELIA
jgi:hypothetical protein